MKDFSLFEKELGFSFKNKDLLTQAFCHRSYLNENPQFHLGQNERLEFLGDAVLGLVIAEKLYHDFPKYDEGKLTKLRSILVRGATLARVARLLRIGDYLYLGRGEESSGGRRKPANLAGALEAYNLGETGPGSCITDQAHVSPTQASTPTGASQPMPTPASTMAPIMDPTAAPTPTPAAAQTLPTPARTP